MRSRVNIGKRLAYGLLRLGSLGILLAVLVGVPTIFLRAIGSPNQGLGKLGAIWRSREVDTESVLAIGSVIFLALWLWFVFTALVEIRTVLAWRRGRSDEPLVRLSRGPDQWVRRLVRVVALSSVSAATVLHSWVPTTTFASDASPQPSHIVERGDCYWDIADDHLAQTLQRTPTEGEVLRLTERLLEHNHLRLGHDNPALLLPGEIVILPNETQVASPLTELGEQLDQVADPVTVDYEAAPSDAVPEVASPDQPSMVAPYVAGMGTALLLSAGALGVIESRRRRSLRSTTVGARLIPPSPTQSRTEQVLRSLAEPEKLARMDVALRSAASDLAAQDAVVVAISLGDHGEISLYLRGSATPSDAVWRLELHSNTWNLAADTPLADLIPKARRCAHPCPAIVHLGRLESGGELFVDLEAIGVLSVVSLQAPQILQHAYASLAVSPFLDGARIFSVGLDSEAINDSRVEGVDSLDAALDAAATAIGSTMLAAADSTTFALRVAGVGGESWEPAIVVAAGEVDASDLDRLAEVCVAGRGLGVMIHRPVIEAREAREWRIVEGPAMHELHPLGLRLHPAQCEVELLTAVTDLVVASDRFVEPRDLPVVETAEGVPFVEPEWTLMLRLFGQVGVSSRDGSLAEFERSKALELVVWLSQHRERPTRNSARTALWDVDVRDATFANVVSDARRALARSVAPPTGEEWIARTLTEDLPLHRGVVTDAQLLSARVDHARGLPLHEAIAVLRPGVELLGGMPFAGTSYMWTDGEGVTSSLVLLATGAAIELGNHYLSLGDIDGVFWATGQGLKVLAGHEELIALRMRAHAYNGDNAGVRQEWESYERALAADPWAAAEPAPKLVALRHQLLAPPLALADSRAG